jgi:hypothetical protein
MHQKINRSAVNSLQERIHWIIKYDLYIRVAAMLQDAGITSESLCGNETMASALCSGPNAVPSPFATNAIAYLRAWEKGYQVRPAGIPKI